jgi:6-phosphogluconolactonase (cycloisomerase 2 family)
MKTPTTARVASAAALALGLGLVSAGAAGAAPAHQRPAPAHALFVETDNSVSNTILSYQRSSDGTIALAGTFSTGGAGGTAANATADPLASQGGLTLVDGNRELLAVNAGSDTVSVFAVEGTSLRLTQQISSGGLFPDSISAHGRLVAVLNAGGAGSLAEFSLVNGRLVALPDQVRSLGLANTTPPDFHHGAGQVSYTPNGQDLIVTTKLSTNAYEVFTVGASGTLGATPVVTPADNALPFSFTFDSAGNVVATEASDSSVAIYRVTPSGSLTSLGSVSDGGAALCWISGANGYFYGSNAGSGTLSLFTENDADVPTLLSATAATAHAGTTDSVISPDGDFLYVESGGAGTIDAFAIGASGALTQIETIYNVPTASEGIAAS